MKITKTNIASLEKKYRGYMKGPKVDAFFEDFGIKFSAGHWCAGDFCDRFAPAGYNCDNPDYKSDFVSQAQRVKAAGIKGVELQSHLFIGKSGRDGAAIREAKDALRSLNLVPTNMGTTLFADPKWKLGGLTNADRGARKAALETAMLTIDIAREIGCTSVSLWPGSDGWDYDFEVNYGLLLDRFIEGCAAINKKAKSRGLKFGIEAKLHEPREGNMVIPTTHMAILIAKTVNETTGGRNMGVAIDYGHEQMYAVSPAFTLHAAYKMGVPVANFHLNDAKTHSNDEDRIAGTGDNWRLADFCYAAIDTGYAGWFSLDQFTYRMDAVKAMALSKELFANVMKKALFIYARKDELGRAQASGDAGKTIDVVKEILV
jgi:xylose isomerase